MNRLWFDATDVWSRESGGYLMPYRPGDIRIKRSELDKVDELARDLDSQLRTLHDIHDNLPGGTDAYDAILFGAGATQLLSAAIYAFSKGQDCVTTAQRPIWGPFKTRIVPYGSGTTWVEEEDQTDGCSIEILTVPSNPDNKPTTPLDWTSNHIYDLVYNWPAYGKPFLTSKDKAVPVAIFSAGKIFGHAASRFGWAFVSDPAIAQYMYDYLWVNGRCSSDAQYRHAVSLKAIVDSHKTEREFMSSAREELKHRWKSLAHVLDTGGVFKIATHGWKDCKNAIEEVSKGSLPTPIVAWIESPKNTNCADLMMALNIETSPGEHFYADENFCRLTVGSERAVFDLVLDRLKRVKDLNLKSIKHITDWPRFEA
jgi:hypothetical protein